VAYSCSCLMVLIRQNGHEKTKNEERENIYGRPWNDDCILQVPRVSPGPNRTGGQVPMYDLIGSQGHSKRTEDDHIVQVNLG
jgi:hypothetical protein